MNRSFVSTFLALLLPVAVAVAAPSRRDDLGRRLRIRAEVIDPSASGGSSETRVFSGFGPDGKLRGDWGSRVGSAPIRLRHEWTLDESGALHVRFEEFGEEVVDSRTGLIRAFKNPIHSETRDLGDAGALLGSASVAYEIRGAPGKNVSIRFTPELIEERVAALSPARKISNRGIVIYDSEGVVWASEVEADGEYVAFTTHRGTLILSFRPFPGSEPAGVAEGRRITLRMKDYPKILLQGLDEFAPAAARAQVHVRYVKGKRTAGLNTVTVLESAEEGKLLARFD